NITYENTDADNATTGARTVRFVLTDGDGGTSANYDTTVTVSAANHAPTFFSVTGDGIVTTDIGSANDTGRDIAIQDDGKVLVAGRSWNGSDYDFALTRYNTDGTLDTGFGGGDGIVTTAIGSGDDAGYDVTIQSDGKILVAGSSSNGSNDDFALIRYNTDGTLDTSFGGGDGIVTTAIGSGNELGMGVSVQVDGKVVVAGYSHNGSNHDFALTRYNTDGTLDTSFGGGDGIVTTAISGADLSLGKDVTLQSDGKILVTGYGATSGNIYIALTRYNTDGTLDTSFGGGDGTVTTDLNSSSNDNSSSVTTQPDGKILVGGTSNIVGGYDFVLTRYNTDGTLDTSFGGGDGIVRTDFQSGNDYASSVTLQSDGKILLTGNSRDGGGTSSFGLARYDSDGTLDISFGGGDGKLTTSITGGDDFGQGVAVGSDGKILVSGYGGNGSNDDFALVRYNADGSLDTSFDTVSTLDGTPTFTEGGAAVVLDADVDISDVELDALNSGNGNYNGASVTLSRNGGANADDVFSNSGSLGALTQGGNLVYGATTIGTVTTNSAGTLLLTFNTNATSTLVDLTLQSIAYSNSRDTPPATAQIAWS
ncbi:MAG: hypothetical protein GY794_22290, partial [bacterium]|nr:hypothetical protein [bacterium]